MFVFIATKEENRVVINHLLLMLKFNVHKSRDLETLNFLSLKSDIISYHVEMIFENRERISKNGGN